MEVLDKSIRLLSEVDGKDFLTKYRELEQSKYAHERSTKHFHVSDLLREIGLESMILDWEDKQNLAQSECTVSIGLAWEQYVSKVFHTLYKDTFVFHPGEFIVGDIAGNPDAIEFITDDQNHVALHEFKFSYKSCGKNHPLDYWYWTSQIKAYKYLMEHETYGFQVTKCCLHVLFVNGDYKRQSAETPQYRIYTHMPSNSSVTALWEQLKKKAQGKKNERTNK